MKCRNRALIGLIVFVSTSSLWFQLHVMMFKAGVTSETEALLTESIQPDLRQLTNETLERPLHLLEPRGAPFRDLAAEPSGRRSDEVTQGVAENNASDYKSTSHNSDSPPPLELPGIHHYLPHLRGNLDYFDPSFKISKNRSGVQLVIGVPTIRRPKIGYLNETLKSLLSNLETADATECLIIVFIAEPWNSTYVKETATKLQQEYSAQLESGLLEIMAPSEKFYPSLDGIPLSLNDTEERVRWRTKQNLDYAYLMMQAANRGRYYIQLEDDVITKPRYYQLIMEAVKRYKQRWMVLSFSGLGFIGKLFRTSDLPRVLEFLLMFYTNKPGDWLIDNLLSTQVCGKDMTQKECNKQIAKISIGVRPALFQHIGYHSSLKGKIQKLKEKTFAVVPRNRGAIKMPKIPRGKNPAASSIESTITAYASYDIIHVYAGSRHFWGVSPVKDDIIEFHYEPPITITRYKIVTGSPRHPQDMFSTNTTIEVKLYQKNNSTLQNTKADGKPATDTFTVVGHFDEKGKAEGSLYEMGDISSFRIHVNSDMKVWVIISELTIVKAAPKTT